jgi:hypothetical protein
MSKRLILVLALALVIGTSFAAYAEVQNVKISGDINMMGVLRNNFNLGNPVSTGTGVTKEDDKGSFFLTQTRVRIDADLTDNVSATVRLINERNWTSETNSSTDIDLDLAYVTLKEFLYSPLTLTLGRQEIRFGNQLIIGNNGTYTVGTLNGTPSDLSERNAFDALRATLNYDPLIIDAVYAKVSNNNVNASDDTDLFGINASYDITKKVNLQAYIWDRKDKSQALANNQKDDTYTVGGLLTVTPIANLKTSLEAAFQFGTNRNSNPINGVAASSDKDTRKAFAVQALADYTFAKAKFTPSIGGGYTYLSGSGDDANWNAMYYNQNFGNIATALLPFSNMHIFNLKGSMKPMDDITLSLLFGHYMEVEKADSITSSKFDSNGTPYLNGRALSNKTDLGNEIDTTITYDYTEDVQLGFTYGAFMPGDAIHDGRMANQAVASMKVTF